MSASRVIVCPGQGAQSVGMGRAWLDRSPEARRVFETADRVVGSRLGAPLTTLCFQGPAERLNQTDVSQPAIYVTGVACVAGLLAAWGAGDIGEAGVIAGAGLSLGEYTALHLAGVFSFEQGLELVLLRGRAMQDAACAVRSGMVALIGADETQARAICAAAAQGQVLVCANFNAPGQIVLSGHAEACARASQEAAKGGLRATPLPVAGAFHSPLMAPAAEKLGAALAKLALREPTFPVVSNVTARPHAPDGGTTIGDMIRRRLVEQLTAPVRWAESCAWMAAEFSPRAPHWHEPAPGKTLAGLMRRIDRGIQVESHDEPA